MSITRAAAERRNRIYGATFSGSIFATAKEAEPDVFRLSTHAYVTIIRAHRSKNQALIAQVAAGIMPQISAEVKRVVIPRPPYVPKARAKK
jgi:hypothetical protein